VQNRHRLFSFSLDGLKGKSEKTKIAWPKNAEPKKLIEPACISARQRDGPNVTDVPLSRSFLFSESTQKRVPPEARRFSAEGLDSGVRLCIWVSKGSASGSDFSLRSFSLPLDQGRVEGGGKNVNEATSFEKIYFI